MVRKRYAESERGDYYILTSSHHGVRGHVIVSNRKGLETSFQLMYCIGHITSSGWHNPYVQLTSPERILNSTLISNGPDFPQSPSIYYVGTYVGICMFGSTTRKFKGCALALSDVRWLSEEKILRCQLTMRTLNNAGAVELTIYLVKMPVCRRRGRFCQNPSQGRRFWSDFLNIWRCSFAFNASHLLRFPLAPLHQTQHPLTFWEQK